MSSVSRERWTKQKVSAGNRVSHTWLSDLNFHFDSDRMRRRTSQWIPNSLSVAALTSDLNVKKNKLSFKQYFRLWVSTKHVFSIHIYVLYNNLSFYLFTLCTYVILQGRDSKWVRQALVFNALVVLIISEVASITHWVTSLNVVRSKKQRRGSSFTERQWERDQTWVKYLSWQQHVFESWMNLNEWSKHQREHAEWKIIIITDEKLIPYSD